MALILFLSLRREMTRSWRHRPLLPNNGIFIADGLRCGIRVYSDAGVRDECDDELLSAILDEQKGKESQENDDVMLYIAI